MLKVHQKSIRDEVTVNYDKKAFLMGRASGDIPLCAYLRYGFSLIQHRQENGWIMTVRPSFIW